MTNEGLNGIQSFLEKIADIRDSLTSILDDAEMRRDEEFPENSGEQHAWLATKRVYLRQKLEEVLEEGREALKDDGMQTPTELALFSSVIEPDRDLPTLVGATEAVRRAEAIRTRVLLRFLQAFEHERGKVVATWPDLTPTAEAVIKKALDGATDRIIGELTGHTAASWWLGQEWTGIPQRVEEAARAAILEAATEEEGNARGGER